jgi:hypothetical protein
VVCGSGFIYFLNHHTALSQVYSCSTFIFILKIKPPHKSPIRWEKGPNSIVENRIMTVFLHVTAEGGNLGPSLADRAMQK